ncbi:unnamed protein product [Mycena citricolor]|uniref:Uncharacterized protein n=1 Tax=Mycena citricolor TaxID=2018698 RepID=A0AAD2HBA4_9AGAR|nr:unnamed protein product [Mycena citricolor]
MLHRRVSRLYVLLHHCERGVREGPPRTTCSSISPVRVFASMCTSRARRLFSSRRSRARATARAMNGLWGLPSASTSRDVPAPSPSVPPRAISSAGGGRRGRTSMSADIWPQTFTERFGSSSGSSQRYARYEGPNGTRSERGMSRLGSMIKRAFRTQPNVCSMETRFCARVRTRSSLSKGSCQRVNVVITSVLLSEPMWYGDSKWLRV